MRVGSPPSRKATDHAETGRKERAMSEEEDLTYGRYLRIGELLELQQLRSRPPHPEELHFIIVHQAIELWMKLQHHDLERIIAALDAGDWAGALALLGRANQVMTHVLDQMRTLHTLPPWALEEFRSYLGTASGSQSRQFRELELLSGLRDPAYLKALEAAYGEVLPEALAARRDQRSLAEAHLEAGRRLGLEGIERWADLYTSPGELATFYLVCVALVERSLGDHARGTGGMALTWLRRTTRFRFFPVLWALRDELVVRGGGELVGKPGPPVAG